MARATATAVAMVAGEGRERRRWRLKFFGGDVRWGRFITFRFAGLNRTGNLLGRVVKPRPVRQREGVFTLIFHGGEVGD